MKADKTVMQYDSTPPMFYDDPASVYDENPIVPAKFILPMKYAILQLNNKNLDQKLTLTTDLTTALTTNLAVYATPDPTVLVLTDKVTAIRTKKTELDAALAVVDTKQGELDTLELELDNLLNQELAYIQKTSGGDEAKITLLGLSVKGAPSPATAPDQVQNLKLAPGKGSGEVLSYLKPLAGAKSYDYDYTTDPTKEENWKHLDTSSGCRTKFTGLVSGQKIWVRARAVGKKNTGKGAWSDSASITVP